MAVLGLRFCARALPAAASGGHSSSRCAGLSLSWLRSTDFRRTVSAVVAHGPSCSAACGIFPDQGSNPCPLHWQADSQPLRHQGSPLPFIFIWCDASFKCKYLTHMQKNQNYTIHYFAVYTCSMYFALTRTVERLHRTNSAVLIPLDPCMFCQHSLPLAC